MQGNKIEGIQTDGWHQLWQKEVEGGYQTDFEDQSRKQ